MARRRTLGAVAVLVGVALGLWLLGSVRPGQLPPSSTRVVGTPARPVEAPVRARTEAKKATPRPPAAAPIRLAPVEPADTGTDPEEEPASVVVDVVDPDGRPVDGARVIPLDCPGLAPGPPGEFRVEPGRCVLQAVRRDGALLARSAPASVEAVPGPDPAYLQLELRNERTGGIGVRFEPDADGMRVLQVMPGTPAERAGLEPGDLVLAIGGEETAEMDAREFVERMTGPEGTEVEFTVGQLTDTGLARQTLVVRRSYLEG